MPVPPAPAEEGAEAKAEPRLEFSHVECLLYALHQLARHKPEFLTDNEEQLKDFRARSVQIFNALTRIFDFFQNYFYC